MLSTDTTDENLVRQAGAGDRRAAAALIRRHSPKLLGLATRMLNDPSEAEDVVQDTFIRVWRAAANYQPGAAKVSTWMCKIAVNLCLDRLRKTRPGDLDSAPEIQDESATPHESLEVEQRSRIVNAAMIKLPERQRAALSLCYFQELTNIEAADILEVSVDALESLLARGRRGLKSLLEDARTDLMMSTPQGRSAGSRP